MIDAVNSRPPGIQQVPTEFLQRIVAELHPAQIWLYGSRARGTSRLDSDWDILAVLPDSASEDDLDPLKLWARLRDLYAHRLELVTITRSDFDHWKRSLGTLAQIVADEGIVVYGE
jgi:predicted nucleotidyltransferase